MKKYIVFIVLLCLMLSSCGSKNIGSSQKNPASGSTVQEEAISSITKNAIGIPSAKGYQGENITVPLYVSGEVEFCAFDIAISYNPDEISFIGTEEENEKLLVNCNTETGTIYANYVDIHNVKEDTFLCNLIFKALTDEPLMSEIDVEIKKMVAVKDNGDLWYPDCSDIDNVFYLNGEEVYH